ncbi:Hsp70 protein-domain-containing protein [Dioszegia hungarica]|uniref:Hsp70 protein-domain-containing protein n=1 Tax=Dioszegia hungarica TaxID=4972 RepID=A0AA38LV18_9TREE|nr:Hsp70 protein-domain-containing protein [Dioszegia hungarica]KAI9637842.1 Hsp70 protein-domain-containing protein [Dioszegia hungarica]
MKLCAHLLWASAMLLSPAVQAAVLAIDYGAEFTKLSLVKPGVPFDVVLDRDSKRKISSVVGWKRDDRVFGSEGKMSVKADFQATRFPDTHFPYIKPLLASSSEPSLPLYPSPPTLVNDTLIFPHVSAPSHLSPAPSSPQEVWSPTALLAHQLAYFRGLASSLAGEVVKDVIVTAPAWWTQSQRRAYRDALELQGLTCMGMIGEGTAVGLNYAMTRSFPDYNATTGEGEREFHIIYDSGALSTTATVLAFYQTSVLPTPKSKTPINTTHIEVLATGWEQIGGVQLDLILQDMLVTDFAKKSGSDVSGDKKAMAKLAREANRVKHILSANQESNVAIESLFNDVDYKSRISRADLEAAFESSLTRFSSPITTALIKANLSIKDMTSVILFGGNTRVPLVQSSIRSVLGDKEDIIAQNVNSDEAAVLGAVFYGAGLSKQFKMKKLELHERSVYDFQAGVAGEVIFPAGTLLGERKTMVLPAVDQSVEVMQDGHPLFAIQFTDVAAALSNFSTPEPVINLTFRLDHRGHIAAANAVVVSNATASAESTGGMAGALKGLFGKKEKKEDGEATVEEGTEEDVDAKDVKKEVKKEKVAVKFREKALGLKAMTGEEKRVTMARLASIASFEAARTSREEARNMLEGYLYRLTGLLDPQTDNTALQEYSKPDEQDKLRVLKEETFEWLLENAEGADEKTLREKRTELEKLEAPIILRFQESRTRPKAVEDFQQAMFAARSFLVEAQSNVTIAKAAVAASTPESPAAPPKYTDEELTAVEVLMKELEEWMDEVMTQQVFLEEDKTATPVVMTKELDERGKKLQTTVLRLTAKKNPRAPKAKTASSSSSSTTSSSSTASTEAELPTGSAESDAPKHEEL